MALRIDFDDFLAECDEAIEALRDENIKVFSEAGEEAVRYAVENGAYKNRTGVLRKSNKSEVTAEENINLALENEAFYASFVEAKGYDVLSGAFLETKNNLERQFQ